MKKLLILLVATLLIITSFSVYADNGQISFDKDNSIVKVEYKSDSYEDLKVRVKKGNQVYYYNLYDDNEVFPLQMGSGKYEVSLFKRVSPNSKKYRSLGKKSEDLNLKENSVFLQSVQNVNWSDKSKAIELAKKLSLDKVKDEEKFKAIYGEIVRNIVYDHVKAESVSSRYLPLIDKTLEEKKGICYDYSSLMASMLRSMDIPTKMIFGNAAGVNEYHAWNEVYLNDKWIVIDTTVDAVYVGASRPYNLEKSKDDYKGNKEF